MAKRKMVQSNLVRNSISSYFAAVEIHNKPNISYRYETVTLLMMNAWELILKAFVRKNIKSKSIFKKDGHTISVDKALDYVSDYINGQKHNSFKAIRKNIEEVQKYRNNIAHFYCDELEPYIFMLTARSALNYVEFVKKHFQRDILDKDGLFILPLGFKLPFRPEDFLADNVGKYAGSKESQEFIQSIVNVTSELKEEGVEDSIVLGFDIFFKNVKKSNNSDIIAVISKEDPNATSFLKESMIRLTDDPSAQTMNLQDEKIREIWKYSHQEVVEWCKDNIDKFKQGTLFNSIKRELCNDKMYVFERRLDERNKRSPSQKFYSGEALKKIKEMYEEQSDESK